MVWVKILEFVGILFIYLKVISKKSVPEVSILHFLRNVLHYLILFLPITNIFLHLSNVICGQPLYNHIKHDLGDPSFSCIAIVLLLVS